MRGEIERLLDAVDAAFPIPSRHRSELPRDVATLSRALTSERSDRDAGYLGKPAELSAYLRYFLPWNVFRLSRLLPSLQIGLADGDAVTDLGSGPLTVPISLYLSRPDLREKRLEFRCLDRTGKVLEAGAAVFERLRAGGACAWKIRTIRGSLGAKIEGPKAALVTAANVLNELVGDDRRSAAEQAERRAVFLSALTRDDGRILVVEPGIPRSGEFLAALRGVFIDIGRGPISPCPHAAACPLPGGRRRAKWCHFAFDTEEAPERLHRLSAAAGIPKERATLSFVLAGRTAGAAAAAGGAGQAAVRVVSDSFALPGGRFGRYGCFAGGLALVTGDSRRMAVTASGALLTLPRPGAAARRDEKSGAVIFPLGETSAGIVESGNERRPRRRVQSNGKNETND
jgi:hypothetical protein